MIRYAAAAGAIDEAAVVRELWVSLRRAGASIILTYHAAAAVEHGWI
jgi:porphobilinogen synthase